MTAVDRPRSSAETGGDAFAFGAPDMHLQGMRNLMVLATLPWAAFVAMGAEFAAGRRPRRDD